MSLRRAVFLDRDGVLNVRPAPHTYVQQLKDLVLIPDAPAAVATLTEAGLVAVVISNQQGVARGLVSPETLAAIDRRITAAVAQQGGKIEAFFYCPHAAEDLCHCRKPRPGLLLEAADALGLDLEASFLIGDSETDVEAGRAAGCTTLRIDTNEPTTQADHVAPTMTVAANTVVRAAANHHRCVSP